MPAPIYPALEWQADGDRVYLSLDDAQKLYIYLRFARAYLEAGGQL